MEYVVLDRARHLRSTLRTLEAMHYEATVIGDPDGVLPILEQQILLAQDELERLRSASGRTGPEPSMNDLQRKAAGDKREESEELQTLARKLKPYLSE